MRSVPILRMVYAQDTMQRGRACCHPHICCKGRDIEGPVLGRGTPRLSQHLDTSQTLDTPLQARPALGPQYLACLDDPYIRMLVFATACSAATSEKGHVHILAQLLNLSAKTSTFGTVLP